MTMKKTKISKMIYFAKSKRYSNVTSNECRRLNIDFRNHSIFDVWMLTWHDNFNLYVNSFTFFNIRKKSIFFVENEKTWSIWYFDVLILTNLMYVESMSSKILCFLSKNIVIFVWVNLIASYTSLRNWFLISMKMLTFSSYLIVLMSDDNISRDFISYNNSNEMMLMKAFFVVFNAYFTSTIKLNQFSSYLFMSKHRIVVFIVWFVFSFCSFVATWYAIVNSSLTSNFWKKNVQKSLTKREFRFVMIRVDNFQNRYMCWWYWLTHSFAFQIFFSSIKRTYLKNRFVIVNKQLYSFDVIDNSTMKFMNNSTSDFL